MWYRLAIKLYRCSLVSPEVASTQHTRVAFHSYCVGMKVQRQLLCNPCVGRVEKFEPIQTKETRKVYKYQGRCRKTEPTCRVRAIICRSCAQDDTLLSFSSRHVRPCSATTAKVDVVVPPGIILSLRSSVPPHALLHGLSKCECDRRLKV